VSEPSPEKSLLSATSKNPQALLRHSFRTIKEGTFLLVQITKKLLENDQNQQAIQVAESVGDLLCHQLVTIRHKGAFMCVEENFGLLCKALACGLHAQKYDLLEKWLKVLVCIFFLLLF
jgi:hypothetical protein